MHFCELAIPVVLRKTGIANPKTKLFICHVLKCNEHAFLEFAIPVLLHKTGIANLKNSCFYLSWFDMQ